MRYTILIIIALLLTGCAFVPAFHNTAQTELEQLSETLTDTRLDDLFRQYPTLRFVNSTEIGDGNIRHEFSYTTIEKEDESKRPFTANAPYLDVNFFLFEGANESFGISILPRASALGDGNLNAMFLERGNISL